VAGSILGINPFDQPDVEASKIATRKLTSAYEQTGSLPPEGAFTEVDGLKIFGDLNALLHSISAGDYFALLAYLEMNPQHQAALESIRVRVRDTRRVATCVGFGPRFLHSTGQAYKGGPNSGVFLQITADSAQDLPVPGQRYTFGVVKAAQARGDLQVLEALGRRVLRVHLGVNIKAGLATLAAMLDKAL
jgi:transaldolase/glucose-6-phosphate isomerase